MKKPKARRYCNECDHCVTGVVYIQGVMLDNPNKLFCGHPDLRDIIDYSRRNCREVRNLECGEEGKYFEPKTP